MDLDGLLDALPDPAPLFAADAATLVPRARDFARTLRGLAAALREHPSARAATALRELDVLAASVAWEFNRVQSVEGSYAELTSLRTLDDPSFPIAEGGFQLLLDGAAFPVEVDFHRRAVAVRLAALSPALEAAVQPDGRLRLRATAPGGRFGFACDSSGFLAAVGLNAFFAGRGAADLEVVPDLRPGPPERFAALRDLREVDGKRTFEEYLRAVSKRRRSEAAAIRRAAERDALLARQREARERMDVDAAFMIRLQRSIQAADRVAAAVEDLVTKGSR